MKELFYREYADEAERIAVFAEARFKGPCPKCGMKNLTRMIRNGHEFLRCRECRKESSITYGTPMANSSLPNEYEYWYKVFRLMDKVPNMTSGRLRRAMGKGYMTAHFVKAKKYLEGLK